ncbi:MAG: methionyl-tRNA formyltransferase [Dehalococcoidia bacterium]|nr:methionyl-tRNA formyltransferase [Dehalococcoidia bacterium]
MATIVFMGTPEFAVPSLARLHESRHTIAAVYTQPDRPAGRGRKVEESPVKAWALRHGLRVKTPESFRQAEAVEELRRLEPEVLAVVAYGKLLPQQVLEIPSRGALNVHPSLLPRWRGPSPIAAAVLAGDRMTGVTVMLLDAGMDTGPVLAQREEEIGEEDTAAALGARLAGAGAELLCETLDGWLAGAVTPRAQDAARATVCGKLAAEDGALDFSRPAEELARRVRALGPWPGTFTLWRGERLKVLEARALGQDAGAPGGAPGVVAASGEGMVIGAGAGALLVRRVQPAGKRAMTAQEFLTGRPEIAGERLPS